MPVYEYVCNECGHQFDRIRPMSQADSPVECSNCQSPSTHRKLSRFFAVSEGRSIVSEGGSCASCGGGSCGSCGSHHN